MECDHDVLVAALSADWESTHVVGVEGGDWDFHDGDLVGWCCE